MSTIRNILTLAIVTIGLTIMVPGSGIAETLSPAFANLTPSPDNPDSLVEVIVLMDSQAARKAVRTASADRRLSRSERIQEVTGRLRSIRSSGAAEVEAFLCEHSVGQIKRFFIVSGYAATIKYSSLQQLAAIDGVVSVLPNVPLTYEPPVEVRASGPMSTSVSDPLEVLNAPALWQRGYTGKGRLVCSFDTGVEQSHPALSSRWRGNHASLSESWFSTIKPDSLPYDAVGHGTHTMGIMVGAEDADTIGIAPGAEFIAAGVVDQGKSLSATLADILSAYEWILDPDGNPMTTDDVPDVVLNSWGIPAGLFEDCDDTFWEAIDNVEAAGIVAIFSAGNEGPEPQTLRDPADRASTPLNSFCIGAVDNNKVIAPFSSHGPSRCHPTEIKPEVMAPGVSILSSTKGGGYIRMSGTSMAAPYIAGLVAICRQYNPDATVEEIKTALILSCEDLGPAGEDNGYGHGLVDASKVLDYLPEPTVPDYSVDEYVILGSEQVNPGDSISLMLQLANPAGNSSLVVGRLVAENAEEVDILTAEAYFDFSGMSTIAVNNTPFELVLPEYLVHGTEVGFRLYIETTSGSLIDSTSFYIPAGITPPGSIVTHRTSGISLSVSDFGQIGLGYGSIYNAGGTGFRFSQSDNLLYEAGIILSGNGYDLSSAVRSADGSFRPSDFSPVEPLSAGWLGDDDGYHLTSACTDTSSIFPAPVRVSHESIDFDGSANDGVVILRYHIENESAADLDSLRFGFLADFDLEGSVETVGVIDSLGLVYQYGQSGAMVGLVMLENVSSVSSVANIGGKIGWTEQELVDMMSPDGPYPEEAGAEDMLFCVGSPSLTIASGAEATVSFALIGGEDRYELEDNAVRARERYRVVLAAEAGAGLLPGSFALQQNYPNPFNPTTTIAFEIKREGSVNLDIYNSLGQKVKRLHSGFLPVGEYSFEWNGTNFDGAPVATGVYFYRLASDEISESRKMVLLK